MAALFPHMSDYYRLIAVLFKESDFFSTTRSTDSGIYYPQRFFNPSALLTSDGRSIIEALLQISNGILIEDGDLSRDSLLKHLENHTSEKIVVHDLSRALRLSINHIYWITKSHADVPVKSEVLWKK